MLDLSHDRPLITLDQLAQRSRQTRRIRVLGACPGATALWVRALARQPERRPIVVVTRDLESARAAAADLRFVAQTRPTLFDLGEQSPYAAAVPDRRAAQQRLATLHRLSDPQAALVVVPAAALARKVVPKERVARATLSLALGEEIDRDGVIRALSDTGYLRVPLVEDPGSLSVRGALLDVWPVGHALPVRLELDGDTITNLRSFDPIDQRGREQMLEVALPPAREAWIEDEAIIRERLRDLCDAVNWPSSRTRNLIDDVLEGRAFFGAEGYLPAFGELEPLYEQLPADALVVLEEPSAIASAIDAERVRGEGDALERADQPHFPASAFWSSEAALDAWLGAQHVVALSQSPIVGDRGSSLDELSRFDDDTPTIATSDHQVLSHRLAAARGADGHAAALDPLTSQLAAWLDEGLRVVITARATTQAERLVTMLAHRDVRATLVEADADPLHGGPELAVAVGDLERGVVAPTEGLVLLTEEEVFGRRAHRRKVRLPGKRKQSQLLEDLRSLAVGDAIVHVDHGVGRYEGLIHREVAGITVDLLVVSYAGGDKLYLPVYRLSQIHKFHGGDGEPKLDKLGGQSFSRTKARARDKARDIAEQLLALYAERQGALGEATPPIDDEYRAFEATFPHEETDDQARAIDDVGADLEAPRPMDRLVCGDVGFGKTEVALRAAFRVAMSGRQVALLCPTTVLAQQHKLTFDLRLAGYPMNIAALSRFQSDAELDHAIRGLRDGSVDVAIGTHRILSKDVHFKNLGLLVVDEEQRFGVAAKERIKALKKNVDVLTLTATPIPRTLQMSISGLRDMSVITTPPADRRAVRTIVTRPDATVLREAIQRELSRGGQVFFVYNRIAGLEERAALVQQLVPEARIAVAHGRMNEARLEQTMLDFVAGAFDVLCTTAIIENGLDIPRCNTIIIDRADLFGLAQLYQLRGRVGRSRERGYCYLVLPPGDTVSDDARVRIEALQRYADLGSGFQIASLDLDLRGAGELLGAEQSGVVAAVGFEMFCTMLEDASAEARGEPAIAGVDPELSFDVEALLPESYVPDIGVRLSFYKRLAGANDDSDVAALSEEMEDRFGRPPPEARRYLQLMRIKAELRNLRVLGCEASASTVTLHLRDDTPLDAAAIGALLSQGGKRGALPYKLTPDMRLTRRAREGELFASGLAHCERMLSELGQRS